MKKNKTVVPVVPADPMDTLRNVSQPQRDLIRFLHGQFQNGKLKPGGKVMIMRGGGNGA